MLGDPIISKKKKKPLISYDIDCYNSAAYQDLQIDDK